MQKSRREAWLLGAVCALLLSCTGAQQSLPLPKPTPTPAAATAAAERSAPAIARLNQWRQAAGYPATAAVAVNGTLAFWAQATAEFLAASGRLQNLTNGQPDLDWNAGVVNGTITLIIAPQYGNIIDFQLDGYTLYPWGSQTPLSDIRRLTNAQQTDVLTFMTAIWKSMTSAGCGMKQGTGANALAYFYVCLFYPVPSSGWTTSMVQANMPARQFTEPSVFLVEPVVPVPSPTRSPMPSPPTSSPSPPTSSPSPPTSSPSPPTRVPTPPSPTSAGEKRGTPAAIAASFAVGAAALLAIIGGV